MHLVVVVNPSTADALDALREAVRQQRAAGHTVEARVTFEAGDAARFAAEAAACGAELLVAAGGDGTINEVVNGVLGWREARPAERRAAAALPRLGIVPLGTANDLATELGLPTDPAAALAVAVGGREAEVDVARVNQRFFLNVSTGGIGAEATDETPQETKNALGPLAYLITGVRKFVLLETSSARFRAGDRPLYHGRFLLFAVGNGRRTGSGNYLTPAAEMDDALLDLCVVEEMSRVDFLRLMPELRAGGHLQHPKVRYFQAEEITIEAETELSVNADGEPLRARRLHYALAPVRLRLMLPR